MILHILAGGLIATTTVATGAESATPARFDSGTVSGLGARNIGSAAMSGRISAMAAHNTADGKVTLYVGAASGGVWKSIDGGTTFKPVFDKQPVQSIGAIALDPSNEKTVWVGTGETWTRNSVSVGNGIYKSTDGGDSWTAMGLPESERINDILVHPKDGNTVYACVPGKLWSDSAERGLYKTTDGGKTWQQILKGSNLSTGCSGITMDPKNPDLLYAGLWDFRRKGWTFRSGGDGPAARSGSGLFRTADGGKTWTEISADNAKGLPAKPWGRVETEIAPSNPDRVYTFIEGVDSGLYVSDDGGKTFQARDKSQMMVWRPFYFAKLIVDPTNADRVFKTNLFMIVSDDAGRSFTSAAGATHGDSHALWINPRNAKHLILGDDGGLWISQDGGNRWWKGDNLPISQFYHVSTDDKDPYQVYGGLQDNSSWVGDSQFPGGITNDRWENLYGGDGFWVFADPSDPDYVYAEYQGGNISRINRKTRAARDIQPKARYGEKLRFNWNTPIHVSPNDKKTLYIGSQFLFRTRDHGQNWERISPDLTTNNPQKQKQELSGGITVDNSSAEMHTTIYSISESPRNAQVIWVGTDDGNLQLTRDGGATWTEMAKNIKGLPAASWVSWVEASRHDEATAYATFDRHSVGDMTPYVYKTTDFGRTWTPIAGTAQGLRGYAHVVKEDSVDPDLLFVGTEFGLWISIDRGLRWAEFKGGDFPSVAVRDIVVQARDNDLVLATHGRGIWIIDDISPLRQLNDDLLAREAGFLEAQPVQQRFGGIGGWSEGDAKFAGQNPAGGAVISYYQKSRHLFGPIKLEILDAAGNVIDTIPAAKRRGINRVSWSMRVAPPRTPKAAQVAFNSVQGPRVVPGKYTVRLTKGKETYTTTLDIALDRRADFSVADRQAQYALSMKVHALFGAMTDLNERLLAARGAAADTAAKLPDSDRLRKDLDSYAASLDEVRKKIVATKEGGAITGEERIREHADQLYGALMSYEGKPATYLVERYEALQRELDDVSREFDTLRKARTGKLNSALKAKSLPELTDPVAPPPQAQLSSGDVQQAFARALGQRAGIATPVQMPAERD
ncbi:WD40/YVTN/BNR-like repeat-containing protein [Tahibacter amnicola]|uniref:Sortilin N-terminal domain-containing protein n=1 Tax=Tahibacter amnicola TaxID=2976241 RepID=A0ABY6BDE4_9GAMM|nr:hypothetical protein [Tahibacter amnicola]UXI68044.1 hypothetical protein N4264_25515 [Tahibacter amnicola]